jgi:hypothetical protein
MKERPILFSGPMVRAILEGRKTQTRRVVNLIGGPNNRGDEYINKGVLIHPLAGPYRCPYGKAGDRLWVRETFSAYAPQGQTGNWKTGENVTYVYRADDADADVARWYPCIFLPRHASRITLEITEVRVERLQEISEADAGDEGAGIRLSDYPQWDGDPDCYRKLFRVGWDGLNAKRGYSWESNPWVWVVEFKRLEMEAAEAAA